MKLSKSIVGIDEANAVSKIICEDGYLGMGAEVGRFETELEDYLFLKNNTVACVSSGTAALHLAITSVIQPGDDVLVPSLTYVATYQAIIGAGGNPISCDIDSSSWTVSLENIKDKITKKTKVIIFVHYASNPMNLDVILDFALKCGIRVIEDAAHSFGCEFNNELIGSVGDIICFSFDGIKNITCGEGGAVVSKDSNVINIVKEMRLLSVENDTENRLKGQRSWDFDVKRIGYRYHMSNINAAIGRVQLNRFKNDFKQKRIKLHNIYTHLLLNNTNIVLSKYPENSIIVPHIFVIRVKNSLRSKLRSILSGKNIPFGMHYKPNHLLTLFKSNYSLPITEEFYDEAITLPLHPQISENEIIQICSIINNL
jgi:dTDP-4-amino-4,6-dideoxygalactose transaminase